MTTNLTDEQRAQASQRFQEDGFFISPARIPDELLGRLREHVRAVIAGDYETGIAPGRNFPPGEGAGHLFKIDNSHLSDGTILEAVSHPTIGEWAAAVTGASMVQVFATQLLYKPPSSRDRVNVGWHQDLQYWKPFLQGELLTAWLAVSDVGQESGPMRFVRGSHHWGLLDAGNFFSSDMETLHKNIREAHPGDEWEEVAAVMPAGGFCFHDRLTIHGSSENRGSDPRVSFAIHLRTDRSALVEGVDYRNAGWLNDFADETKSPVAYRARELSNA